MNTPPRAPTGPELDQLADLSVNGDSHNLEWQEARDQLSAARVAVFDGYITDGPGYCGRVAVVVWSGGPELFDVFTLDGRNAAAQRHDLLKALPDMTIAVQPVRVGINGELTRYRWELRDKTGRNVDIGLEHTEKAAYQAARAAALATEEASRV